MKRRTSGLYWIAVVLLAGQVAFTEAQCSSSSVNVHYDSVLVLVCEGTAPVRWSSHTTVSSQREVITTPPNNAGEQRSWLIYRNATNSDSGITCYTGGGSCSYSVTVFALPSNVRITDSGLTANTVELNSSTTLYCSATGTGPLQYQWYHNGTTIPGATFTTYMVTSAQFSSAGEYTCEVSNWAGRSSETYTLRVQVVPTISSLSSSAPGNKIILPRTGSTSVTISCTASGDVSSVSFQWTLNGGTVPGSSVTATNSGNQVIGQLVISSVTTAHRGIYRCSTSNNVGSDTHELTLTVVDPPTVAAITVNGTAEAVVYALSGTMSEFACIVSGTSPLSTTWELQTTRGVSNRFGTEFNSILTQADEGNYTCTVGNTNEGLSDSATVIIKVYDAINLTSDAMTTLEHKENGDVTLRCSFFIDQDDPFLPPLPVTWTGPILISTTNNATQTTQNNYESTLTFTASRQHHGQFTCSVNDTRVGILEALFNLTVYYSPTNIILQSDSTLVNNGSSTNFTCTGEGRPALEFNITRALPDGTVSTTSGATFVLQPSSKEELGLNLLTCSATNSEYSTPVPSSTLYITIRGAPEEVNSSSIQVISRSFTSVSVQWTQPQDNYATIQYYQIRLGECETNNHSDSPCQLVVPQPGRSYSTSLTLSSLSPFTTYSLEIAAYNRVGLGPYSNAVVIQTVQQDEAIIKNFAANPQGDTTLLLQWHADMNITQNSTEFSYFLLTRQRQASVDEENINLSLREALCPSSTMLTVFCYEWDEFAAGAVYSVWIEMVYSYPATGGRVTLTVTIPTVAGDASNLVSSVAGGAAGGFVAVLLVVVVLVVLILVVLGCRRRKRKGGRQPKESTKITGVTLGKINYSDEEEGNTIKSSGTIASGSAYEPLQVDKVANHSYSQYNFGQATEGRHSHTSAPYEPLQVDKVAHHSYSKCTFGKETEGGQDSGYAPLDITKRPNTVPKAGQTPGEKNGSDNSQGMYNHEYAVLEEATSGKAELPESKKGQGAVTGGNSTGYANIGFALGEGSQKVVFKGKKEQQVTKKVLKGKSQELPPTMTKPSKPKIPPGSKPAAVTKVNVPVPPPPPAIGPAQAPLQSVAKPPPKATAQDSKKMESSKPTAEDKSVKKPILPKQVTASAAPPLVAKKTPAQGGGSPSTGKLSVAELAKRLEKKM